jgi:hypothetical protein
MWELSDRVKLVDMRVYIRLAEALGPRFARRFEDLNVRTETVLFGDLPDRAAVFGVLARMRDLDLAMLDVRIEVSELDA